MTLKLDRPGLTHFANDETSPISLFPPHTLGVGAAKKGALTFMVGGTDDAFERAKPLLDCMGKNVVHCGSHGSGQAVKICNNMLLAISMIGTSEAMQLGIR